MADRPKDVPEELWEARSTLDIACLPVGARELVCRATMAERDRLRVALSESRAAATVGASVAHNALSLKDKDPG